MANTHKDIIIYPNRGSNTADPNISFRGANSASNTEINLRVYPDSNGTLSFEGSVGQLFSVTNDLSGTIFSVNDISGIPSIEVDANGTVSLAEYSGNVGIGTSSPTAKLEVKASTNDQNSIFKITEYRPGGLSLAEIKELNDAGIFTVGYYGLDSTRIVMDGGQSAVLSTIKMYQGADERIRLSTSNDNFINAGNFGIGTSSPAEKLHVNGNVYVSNGLIGLYDPDPTGYSLYKSGTGVFVKSRGLVIANAESDWIRLESPSTYGVIIPKGNVGMGIETPAAKLDIASGSENQTSPVDAIIIRGPNLPANSTSSQNLTWKFAGAGSAIISAHRGGAWDTYLRFSTNDSSEGSDSPRVMAQIDTTGMTVNGNITANDRLIVGGDGGTDGQVRSINGGYLRLLADGGRIISLNTFMVANVSTNFGDMTFATQIDGGGSEVMRLSTTGNVGIGTTSPAAKLHVANSVLIGTTNFEPKHNFKVYSEDVSDPSMNLTFKVGVVGDSGDRQNSCVEIYLGNKPYTDTTMPLQAMLRLDRYDGGTFLDCNPMVSVPSWGFRGGAYWMMREPGVSTSRSWAMGTDIGGQNGDFFIAVSPTANSSSLNTVFYSTRTGNVVIADINRNGVAGIVTDRKLTVEGTFAAINTTWLASNTTSNVGIGTILGINPSNKLEVIGGITSHSLSINTYGVVANTTGHWVGRPILPRVSSAASITSPLAWNSDNFDQYSITAQAEALTINADSGSPVDGQKIIFRLKDDGTARALTWTTGASKAFRAIGVTLPTTTTVNKTTYVGCIYNTADSRWDAIAVATET